MTLFVQAGDVLFIPEGYWHQVDSGGGTIAVNIWFESVVSTMVLESDMSEFYLTRLLQSKAADKAQECLENIPCHPDLKAYCSRGAFPGLDIKLIFGTIMRNCKTFKELEPPGHSHSPIGMSEVKHLR